MFLYQEYFSCHKNFTSCEKGDNYRLYKKKHEKNLKTRLFTAFFVHRGENKKLWKYFFPNFKHLFKSIQGVAKLWVLRTPPPLGHKGLKTFRITMELFEHFWSVLKRSTIETLRYYMRKSFLNRSGFWLVLFSGC